MTQYYYASININNELIAYIDILKVVCFNEKNSAPADRGCKKDGLPGASVAELKVDYNRT